MRKTMKRLLLLGLTLGLLLVGCVACKEPSTEPPVDQETGADEQPTEFVIFENGSYQCDFVCTGDGDQSFTLIRNEFRELLKEKFGVAPMFKIDSKTDVDASKPELLFGQTNRPESAVTSAADPQIDAYAIVAVAGKKVVVNGANELWLQNAMEKFKGYLDAAPTDRFAIPGDTYDETVVSGYLRENWNLPQLPAYPAGESNTVIRNIYNCGTTIQNITTTGSEKDTTVQKVNKTNETEFRAYVQKLESIGYQKEYEKNIEDNLYISLLKDGDRVYLTYTPKKTLSMENEAMIFYEPNAMPMGDFGYAYTPKDGERSEYYLYGLPIAQGKDYKPTDGDDLFNCGELLIIKCADNSVIIIDGGDDGPQMTEEAMQGLDAFLRRITDTPSGEKVRISAWYLTHYHPDHSEGFPAFLQKYQTGYTLERIIANIPKRGKNLSSGVAYYYTSLERTSGFLNATYPDCKELKVHTGQVIQIADVSLQVLYTHEDLLNKESMQFASSDTNDTSTVIRADNGKLSMLVLGDIDTSGETKIRQKFSSVTLKSDILQASHHNYNYLPTLNGLASPTLVFVPNSRGSVESNAAGTDSATAYKNLVDLVGDENIYWGGNLTVGIAFVDGEIREVYRQDGVIGLHLNPDGSRKEGY